MINFSELKPEERFRTEGREWDRLVVKRKETDGNEKVVGTSQVRKDGIEKVIGTAQYGADVNLSGQLYGAIARSPHPHARIKSVNTDKAKGIFEEVKDDLEIIKVDKEDAFKYNHHSNIPMHKNRQKFFDNLENKPIIENIQECLKVSLMRKVLRKCKKIAKKILKRN